MTDVSSWPDEQLVLCIQAGEARADEALRELILRHSGPLDRSIRRKGFTSSEAEDIQQEVWLRASQNLRRYEDRGLPFGAWLRGIARNVVRERLRRFAQFEFTSDVELDEIEGTEDFSLSLAEDLDRKATVDKICELARGGPPDYFKWIEASLAGFTPQETMELYGWSRNKTDQTKLRAVAWIRRRWHEAGSSISARTEI